MVTKSLERSKKHGSNDATSERKTRLVCPLCAHFSLAAARQYASKYHYDIDINQEMLAQGMANFTSGLFQGINVAGSLSKSSVNDA